MADNQSYPHITPLIQALVANARRDGLSVAEMLDDVRRHARRYGNRLDFEDAEHIIGNLLDSDELASNWRQPDDRPVSTRRVPADEARARLRASYRAARDDAGGAGRRVDASGVRAVTDSTSYPPVAGRARYVPKDGTWSLFHLEFDPPLIIPAHHSVRYSTPPPPTELPATEPGPWFPITATFEAHHVG